MLTLDKKEVLVFVKEMVLTDYQAKVLLMRGFTVAYVRENEWGETVYNIYAKEN